MKAQLPRILDELRPLKPAEIGKLDLGALAFTARIIDDIQGKGRVVNFSQPSAETKQGRFTTFLHEPHFGVMENRGCLTCHSLEKGRPYLKSYEQGHPHDFVSNFGAVKKDLCQSCHATNKVREDCLTCHKYHVNGVITPIMNTKIPMP